MTTVINLWGGPGSGKSTTAAGLFFKMKLAGYKVELVTEYAKELVYANKLKSTLQNQILFEQHLRQLRLKDRVDFIITDSPLLLSKIYSDDLKIHKLANTLWSDFRNINVFIKRVKPFASYGREQNEEEARDIDDKILRLIRNLPWLYFANGDSTGPDYILESLEPIKRL